MCGFAGFLDAGFKISGSIEEVTEHLKLMSKAIHRRGPDAGDVWLSPNDGLAMCHQRLSIVDLSAAGSQPMTSSCNRVVISYNGEIYNKDELKAKLELAGRTFRGHSDTEVILEGIATWGTAATLQRLIGMFALAVWDKSTRKLTLARDRMGIKPLYYGTNNGLFLFGSDLHAIKAHPQTNLSINPNAVANFLRHNYVPGPGSIWQGISKLSPGCYCVVSASGIETIANWWSLDEAYHQAQESEFTGSYEDACDELGLLLEDAVTRRMVADVPLGAFLSGGIDSSLVTALMQKNSPNPVKTFTVGFDNDHYDESSYAASVASRLGTEHTTLNVSSTEALSLVPSVPACFDEPFSDSSQLPTMLISGLIRKHVTVALSGDGGDELFGGYTRYAQALKVHKLWSTLPSWLRGSWARKLINPGNKPTSTLTNRYSTNDTFGRLQKIADVLENGAASYYRQITSHFSSPNSLLLIAAEEQPNEAWNTEFAESTNSLLDRMRLIDMKTYLPDDILTKVDRATMYSSLEARVPIIDHRVVEFSLRLPEHFLIHNGHQKRILKDLLARYVPQSMFNRPKMGFGIPLDQWLRGPLRVWAGDLLSPTRLKSDGFFCHKMTSKLLNDHLNGTANNQYLLWDILMFNTWLDHNS